MTKTCIACYGADGACCCTRPVLGERHNEGKQRYDLLPAKAIDELVAVLSFGAKKYSDRNWEKGLSYTATIASLLRHVFAFMRGEDKDAESGLHHMAHAAFGCLALVEFYHTGRGVDDRPYKIDSTNDGCL